MAGERWDQVTDIIDDFLADSGPQQMGVDALDVMTASAQRLVSRLADERDERFPRVANHVATTTGGES